MCRLVAFDDRQDQFMPFGEMLMRCIIGAIHDGAALHNFSHFPNGFATRKDDCRAGPQHGKMIGLELREILVGGSIFHHWSQAYLTRTPVATAIRRLPAGFSIVARVATWVDCQLWAHHPASARGRAA